MSELCAKSHVHCLEMCHCKQLECC